MTQSDDTIVQLLRQAPFSFIGTITHLGAATVSDVPIDDHTAVVQVDSVLHAPAAFSALNGHSPRGSQDANESEVRAFLDRCVQFDLMVTDQRSWLGLAVHKPARP